MKNKASLVLLEQLVMILVFSLAAVLCLRLFAWSDQTSREMEQRDEAVIFCQNTVETIKAAGNLEQAVEILGARQQEGIFVLWSGDVRLEIREIPSAIPGLEQAELCAFHGNSDEILCSIATGWQEAEP